MPSTDSPPPAAPMPETNSAQEPTQSNGTPTEPTAPQAVSAAAEKKQATASGKSNTNAQASTTAKKLTPAELKKKAKEEKAARRAQAVATKGGEKGAETTPAPAVTQPSEATASTAAHPPAAAQTSQQKGSKQKQKQGGPAPGTSGSLPAQGTQNIVTLPIIPKKEDKTVEFFRHLYKQRTTSIAGAAAEVHPAILSLGLQMANYTICGSCARLVAMLQAFKRVIETYTTPPGKSLTRHLASHVLSPQIDYLASCRPISISMGNAIRMLKLEISKVDVDTPEANAKNGLCDYIDTFIRERVTFADKVIARSAADKIRNGDVILTYAKSSIVQRALLRAFSKGKKFRVIVVDSRPLYEGKHLAAALANLGMEVQYCMLNGLVHSIPEVTKVMLGAHAMMSNGRLFARVGTALVAMEASQAEKPVLVLCETIKFTDRVALDSIVHNEIAPADELVVRGGPLTNWGNVKRLQICNLMFDVTPAEFIQEIVTEAGNVPPTAVPVLHRMGNESQNQ